MSLRSLIVAFLLLAAAPVEAAPQDNVSATFAAYQAALLATDGEKAAEIVTQGSRDLYRHYANQALTLDHAALNRVHIADRLTILLLRHSVERERLMQMSGGDIIAYAVEQGWISKEGTAGIRLGNFQVAGDLATGALLRTDGSETPYRVEFLKEDGDWHLNLKKMLEFARIGIEYAVQQAGMSEDEFILTLLEYSTGKKPGPEIWNPPS
ncbi:hypothetical protein AAFN88_14635 [Pelagibius sp. CAU 1746]|uniref:hypothetical protein n=1 Tax=Pelagibius sp. CAU 1746 TaxID=3140370 RepID=UPI00325B826E